MTAEHLNAKNGPLILKLIFISGLSLLFLSCKQQSRETEPQGRTADTGRPGTASNINKDRIVSPHQEELDKALADPAIDNYYKEIYRQGKLIPADETKTLSITKNLFTKDAGKDLFFFIVFTKSMNGADGLNSEAISFAAFQFVTEKTEWFADYFNTAPKLNEEDMDNWARYVWGEILISRENEEKKAVEELEHLLFKNIKETRKEYKIVVQEFIEKVKSRIP